jgi:serine/threonine protein kinase
MKTSGAELTGRTIDGRYEILRLLGEGAMGSVYVARQLAMDREVAVKVIQPDLLSQSRAVGRFMQEARAVSSLHHPNVVTVHDFGRSVDGMLYLVMEYLHGVTLEALLAHGALPLERALPIAAQLCSGLEAAHARGVVHRDLKPVNAMLCQAEGFGPLVKILDFGIASVFDADSHLTQDGHIVGTPAYMAPEQATGQAVGPAADLYALGTVLFHMLAGALPFDVASASVMLMERSQKDAPSLSLRARQPIPEAIERIVMQCLARRPEDRPTSAAVVRAALVGEVESAARLVTVRDGAPVQRPGAATPTYGTAARTQRVGIAWRRGHIVAERYQVEQVEAADPCETVRAVDLRSPEGSTVILRRVPVGDEHQGGLAEILVEGHLSVLARFRHPGIVALRNAAIEGGALFLVTDPPPAMSLDQRLARTGRMSFATAIRMIQGLLPTIEALHGLGIIHQDVRPGTIWISRNDAFVLEGAGMWTLVDAGLPLFLDEDLSAARLYKAPEQLGALTEPIGPEADLYAVGAVLYRMLTDCQPFESRQELDATYRKLTSVVAPPSMIVPEIPPALDDVVVRLLRPRPIDRFRSVAALREALEGVLSGTEPATGRPEVFRRLGAEGQMHGRDPERRQLMALVTRLAEEGAGSTVILRGAPGIGKSRLADEVSFEVRRRGGLVVRAKARDGDTSTPFAVAREALGALGVAIDRLDPDRRAATRERILAAVGELGALVRGFAPWLERLFADAAAAPRLDGAESRDRLLATLCQAILATGTRDAPVCLVLDDLQWMDTGTWQAIELLASNCHRHPLLVICCARASSEDDPDSRSLERLASAGAVTVDLAPLGRDAVTVFVSERLGAIPGLETLAKVLQRLTDGNPAGLRELLEEAERAGAVVWTGNAWVVNEDRLADLPPADNVVSRMRGRLQTLAPTTRKILGSAAVWGGPFDLVLLTSLLPDQPRSAVIDTVVEADRAELLRWVRRDQPGFRDFAHDTLREALLAGIPEEERRVLHRRLAVLLEGTAIDVEDREQRRADHLVHADLREADVPALEAAAARALQGHAATGAVRLASAALARLADRPSDDEVVVRLKLLLASAYALARQPDQAARIHQEILAGKPPANVHAMAMKELADSLFAMGRLRESVEIHSRASELLGYRRVKWGPRVAVRNAWRLFREVWLETRHPRSGKAPQAPDPRRSLLADVLNHEARARFFMEGAAAGGSLLDSLHEARRSGDLPAYVRILSQVGGQLGSAMGWVTMSRRMLDLSVRTAEAAGDTYSLALARATRLMIYGAMGEFDRFDAERAEVEGMVTRVGENWAHALFASYCFDVVQERGRPSEGLPIVLAFTDFLVTGKSRDFSTGWSLNRGVWVALAIGRPDLARSIVDLGLDHPFVQQDRVLLGYLRGLDVQVAVDARDPDRAIRAAEVFIDVMKSGAGARRHCAVATSIAAKAASAAALDAGASPAAVAALRDILARGKGIVRPFPVYRLHLALCEVRLDLIQGRQPAARNRLDGFLRAARSLPQGTVIAAEVLHLAASLEGGPSSIRGRELLREAWGRVSTCDNCLPFKRRLAAELDEPVAGATESQRIASALSSALRLPADSLAESRPAPRVGTHSLLPKGTIELFEATHAAMGALARGASGLSPLLVPVARFAGADVAILLRYLGGTQQPVPVAVFPEDPRRLDHAMEQASALCRTAAERMTTVVEDFSDVTQGFVRGSSAAFPVARGVVPDLFLYLANRSTPGIFDPAKLRNVEAVLPALEAAVLMSDRVGKSDTPG